MGWQRIGLVVVIAAIGGTAFVALRREATPPAATTFSFAELTGSVFLPVPSNPLSAPRVRVLDVPPFDDARSIWGATGRDFRGHIWVGVSAGPEGASAHLMEYIPDEDRSLDHGDVLSELRRAGLYRKGMGQAKIHSKIVPGGDGLLYFASTDEEGETDHSPPRWGGHLWRIDPKQDKWQHLLAVDEGLVAVSGVGRYIYALGYWGHVLYQYDTASGATRRVVVGSVPGHVSRNFLADVRGHAYVPRLAQRPDGSVAVSLVEYDERLKELADTPLEFYLAGESPSANHGIVGLAYRPDGRMVFSTHIGQLYLIEPGDAAARVTALGWLDPKGPAYAPSLFSFGGSEWLAGVAQRPEGFEWVVYESRNHLSAAFPLDTKGLRNVLLYGSMSRDDAGRVYVGGWAANDGGGQRPLLLQLDPGR